MFARAPFILLAAALAFAPCPALGQAKPAAREARAPAALEIRGSADFTARTKAALALLAGSTTFTQIAPYIAAIESSTRSGMVAWAEKPVFQVGEKTWSSGAAWYAGTIAHDGCHSRLYHRAKVPGRPRVPDAAWTGKVAEQKCLAVQAEVLAEIKADPAYIAYVKGLIPNPTYQNIAYSSRTW
jgi:hypothetical protein